ncbi:MAG: hypothetical protein ACPG4Z_02740 [Chitinophagales bacterium]
MKFEIKPSFSLKTIPRLRLWLGIICSTIFAFLFQRFYIYFLLIFQTNSPIQNNDYLFWNVSEETASYLAFGSAMFALLIGNFFCYLIWFKRAAPSKNRKRFFKRITHAASDNIWGATFYAAEMFTIFAIGIGAFQLYLVYTETTIVLIAFLLLFTHLFLRENQGLQRYYKLNWKYWLAKLAYYLLFTFLIGYGAVDILNENTAKKVSTWVENQFGFERLNSSLAEKMYNRIGYDLYFVKDESELKIYWQGDLYLLNDGSYKSIITDIRDIKEELPIHINQNTIIRYRFDKNMSSKEFNNCLHAIYYDFNLTSTYVFVSANPIEMKHDFRYYLDYGFNMGFADCHFEYNADNLPSFPPPPPPPLLKTCYTPTDTTHHFLKIQKDKTYMLDQTILEENNFYNEVNKIIDQQEVLFLGYDDEIKLQTIIDVYSYIGEIYNERREDEKQILLQNPYYALPENEKILRDSVKTRIPFKFMLYPK